MTDRGRAVPGPFDPGLQPERTELAWRRTALAIAIGSLVSLRIFPLVLPPHAATWGLAPGVIGLVAACALWFAARRRQLRMTAWLHSTLPEATLPEATPPTATALGAAAPGSTAPGSTAPGSTAPTAPGGGILLALTVLATTFGALSIVIVVVSSLLVDGG